MRISAWSSYVCSSDLDRRSGSSATAGTGSRAAARARRRRGGGRSPWLSASLGSLDHAAGDHLEAEGLVGAFEDGQDAGVDEVAADVVLLGVAHAAVDLHGLARDPLGGLADVGLDLGGLAATLALGHLLGAGSEEERRLGK